MSTTTRSAKLYLTILAVPLIALLAAGQSCAIDDTGTVVCESGRRCPTGWTCAANQDICVLIGGCGDGITDPSIGEVCDDGDVTNDGYCAADCKSLVGCGDGHLEEGEVCDDGNNISGDGCSADCLSDEMCGNRKLDIGEVCDDGNNVSGDGCSADCRVLELCGNGVRDYGEACDDGNTESGDDCSADCASNEVCGNGYVDVKEYCDESLNDTEECDADCTMPECGDGYHNPQHVNPDTGVAEQCDDGENTPDCDADCTRPRCGDGHHNPRFTNPATGMREQCDDGENTPDCDADCTRPRCGDGFHNAQHLVTPEDGGEPYPEECDEGDDNSDEEPNACRTSCKRPFCGDGVIDDELGEECEEQHPCDGLDLCDSCRCLPPPMSSSR